eukprot:TRINITY_DN676_c0_g2_i1.p1 TRINITY_DN676_c0_g2~~TRINITY_DN676_c0_g2_i1.p1  ORF type:complete len:167 (+),score=61.45 TRINITY_DN676_c0_g2_i1:42-503(+)
MPRSNRKGGAPPEGEADIKACFETFTEGSGNLPAEKVPLVIRALGKCPTLEEAEKIIADAGGKGAKVNFAKFNGYYKQKFHKPEDMDREMRSAFQVLDKDNYGTIMEAELRQILGTLGDSLTGFELDQLLKDVETDQDGRIYYDKFVDQLVTY